MSGNENEQNSKVKIGYFLMALLIYFCRLQVEHLL